MKKNNIIDMPKKGRYDINLSIGDITRKELESIYKNIIKMMHKNLFSKFSIEAIPITEIYPANDD